MSIQIMGAVKECGPRQLSQYSVLDALANYADDFGFCFPSIATISHISRCDERTVRRQIGELEREGWLFVTRKVLNGKGNVYQINLGKIGATVPPNARRSPLFTRLLRTHGDTMSPIFALETNAPSVVQRGGEKPGNSFFVPETSGDTDHFSEDNPQALTGLSEPTQRTNQGGSADKLCHPNRYNHQEPPIEPSRLEPNPPTPLLGVEIDPSIPVNWSRFVVALKSDLASMPATFPGGRALPEIVPGENDFESCFRDWWLESTTVSGSLWELVIGAAKPHLTRQGIAKYRKRLERLLRDAFSVPTHFAVRFEVRDPVNVHHAA